MFHSVAGGLEHYMTLLTARQKIVTSNIANVDTPGYRTRDVNFQSELYGLLDVDNPRGEEVAGLPVKPDGNNVSLDREARLLAENALRFTVASQLARSEIRMIRSAIQEGKTG